ncbi:hypothetical protein BDZ91DRAFT_816983 [Kalaharituber pfeilii]|nr:hypothetical protein BDZ91DRAFT_816983 [Kalaharituber pfeilii]
MNLSLGGKQPKMHEDIIHAKQWPLFSNNHLVVELCRKLKGIEQVLRERELWRDRRSDRFKFLLECPTTYNCSGCNPLLPGGCYPYTVLTMQLDFQAQKG